VNSATTLMASQVMEGVSPENDGSADQSKTQGTDLYAVTAADGPTGAIQLGAGQ
jgi:hypothetical protein